MTSAATVWLVDSRIVGEIELQRGFLWLSAEERLRYDAFLRPQRQRQFLIGRILLRIALGKLLEVPAERISLTGQSNHAPRLNWSGAAPYFSLSHSGSWVACAVSPDTALGLDIEVIDPARDLIALAEQAFDPDEFARFGQLDSDDQLRAFYLLWSTKEAKFKLASNANSVSESSTQVSCIDLSQTDLSIILCSSHALLAIPQIIRSDASE